MRKKYEKTDNFESMLYQYVGETQFLDEVDELTEKIEDLEGDLEDI